MPFLAYPLALLALVALPALAAIYLLRNRFRRQPVSSLFLWQQDRLPREGGTRRSRLRLPPLFYLELAALLALILAAIGPWWPTPGSGRPLIVVLDDSASMQAAAPGGTPREQALRTLRKLVDRHGFSHIRLLLAGTRVDSLGGAATWAELEPLLTRWTCRQPGADLDRALGMLEDLGGRYSDALVLTDQAPAATLTEQGRLRWIAHGAPLPNLAFVNAARSTADGGDRVLLEVSNLATVPQSLTLTLQQGAQPPQAMPLTLDPGERRRLILAVATGDAFTARLSEDPLLLDNHVWLPPPTPPRVRVLNRIQDPELQALTQRALEATGLLDASPGPPHVIFTDSRGSPPEFPESWSFTLMGGDSNALSYAGPFVIDTTHALAAGLELPATIWAAAPAPDDGAFPVIAAGNTPLLDVRSDGAGREHVRLHLVAAGSTLQFTPNWPALIWNMLEWRQQALPGFAAPALPLGADVRLRLPRAGMTVTATTPDGERLTLSPPDRALTLATPAAGLYTVEIDGRSYTCAVNFLCEAESTLTHATHGAWGTWTDHESTRRHYRELTWLCILVALLCLLLHMRLAARTTGT